MSRRHLDRTAEYFDDRDFAVLADLERFRLLGTGHIQRLHFTGHSNNTAALRACSRALVRMREHRLVSALARRIGGVRRGSASYVWQLGPAGDRLLRQQRGDQRRRRYDEPSHQFVSHTLAVADVAVDLVSAARRRNAFAVETIGTEPGNWRTFIGTGGETVWLKPDLHVVSTNGEFEDHQFLEIDLGTEHMPQILAKCHIYQRYADTGAYQSEHGLFPFVVWLAGTPARRTIITQAIASDPRLRRDLFQIRSPDEFVEALTQTTTPHRKEEPDGTTT